jgi:hypothetical protein
MIRDTEDEMTQTERTIESIERTREAFELADGMELEAHQVTRRRKTVGRGFSRDIKEKRIALAFPNDPAVAQVAPKLWDEVKRGLEQAGYTITEIG